MLAGQTKSYRREEVPPKWYLVDATNVTLGRLAVRVADMLRGKHRATFTSHTDTGDFIVVVNAGKIRLSGKKWDDKIYYRHSGYPGGLKSQTAQEILQKKPERLIEMAVKGMLPRNKLGRAMIKKLKVYAGSEHPHDAQKPEPMKAI